jgi:hypothetical protein
LQLSSVVISPIGGYESTERSSTFHRQPAIPVEKKVELLVSKSFFQETQESFQSYLLVAGAGKGDADYHTDNDVEQSNNNDCGKGDGKNHGMYLINVKIK